MITLMIKKDEFSPEVRRLARAGGNWKIVLQAFGAYMLGSVAKNFKDQGRPKKWKDIKDETKIARFLRGNRTRRRKRRIGSPAGQRAVAGAKILLDRGRLSNSIGFGVRKNQVEIGTNVVYAAVHQFGYKKKNIAARPYLIFQDGDVEKFEEIIIDWLERGK